MKNKKEQIKDIVARRNDKLAAFLNDLSSYTQKSFRLIGDENNPKIIIDDKYALSAYVSNFYLHFTDSYYNGHIIHTIKLMKDMRYDIDSLVDILNRCELKELYKVKHIKAEMYITGYNKTKDYKKTMFPVFSVCEPRVYFSREKAREVVEKFGDAYPLEIE